MADIMSTTEWVDHNGKVWNPSVDFSFKGYKLYGTGSYSSQPQELKVRYNAYNEWRRSNGGSASVKAKTVENFSKKYRGLIKDPALLEEFDKDIQALKELFKTSSAAESTLMKLFGTEEPELGMTVSVALAYYRGPSGERMLTNENLADFFNRVGLPTQKLKDSDVKKLVADWNKDESHVKIKLESGMLTYGDKPMKAIVHKKNAK